MKVMADGYAKFGEVFTVPLLHYNMTFLIGPSVAPHFFKATDDEMSQTEARSLPMPGCARQSTVIRHCVMSEANIGRQGTVVTASSASDVLEANRNPRCYQLLTSNGRPASMLLLSVTLTLHEL